VLSAGNTSDGIRDKYHKRPEEAGDFCKRAAERLDGERRGVCVGNVVGTAKKGERSEGLVKQRNGGGTYITENARRKRINFPPPFHGERT
jgi:hypothetical protein